MVADQLEVGSARAHPIAVLVVLQVHPADTLVGERPVAAARLLDSEGPWSAGLSAMQDAL